MIEIDSSVQHCLGQEAAISRIHHLVASLTQKFPQQVHQVNLRMKDHTVDVSFVAYGYLVSWRAEVYDDQVTLIGKIPDSADKFQNKMLESILSRVEAVLMPAAMRIAS